MKRKENKKNFTETDNFERKTKKHQAKKDRSSKRRLTIYDEFDDESLDDYSSIDEDFDDEDDY